jgi:hypothetical protein
VFQNSRKHKNQNTMKTENKTKRPYQQPAVKRVKLDNEISLVMMSAPGNPGWGQVNEPTSTPNPFRDEETMG